MSKVRVSKMFDRWHVYCDTCEAFPFALRPWATTKDHPTAVVIARFHVLLHAAERCPTCDHVEPIPKPEVHPTGDVFSVAGRVYRIVRGGVVPLHERTPA